MQIAAFLPLMLVLTALTARLRALLLDLNTALEEISNGCTALLAVMSVSAHVRKGDDRFI